jgi:hypothetical protein
VILYWYLVAGITENLFSLMQFYTSVPQRGL